MNNTIIHPETPVIETLAMQVKLLDLPYVQKHAFLAGVVAARNIPADQPCSGPLLWLDYDPGENPAVARILATIDPRPASEVRNEALEEAAQQFQAHKIHSVAYIIRALKRGAASAVAARNIDAEASE